MGYTLSAIGITVALGLATWLGGLLYRRRSRQRPAQPSHSNGGGRRGGLWTEIAFLWRRIDELERSFAAKEQEHAQEIAELKDELFNSALERRHYQKLCEGLMIHARSIEHILRHIPNQEPLETTIDKLVADIDHENEVWATNARADRDKRNHP